MVVFLLVSTLGFSAAAEGEDFVIANFNSEETITNWKLTPDTEITNLNPMSAKWVCKDVGETALLKAGDGEIPSDWSGFGYVNLWVYSPEAYNAKMNLLVYTTEKNAAGTDKYHRFYLKINWRGWKLVSIPTWMFEYANKEEGENNSSWNAPINNFRLNVQGWPDGKYEDYTKMVLNLDKIWLSAERPAAAPAPERVTLADFSDGTEASKWSVLQSSTEQTRNGAKYSAKWNDTSIKENWYAESREFNDPAQMDWRNFENLSFYAYSPAATGETIHVQPLSSVGDNASWIGYFRVTFQVDWVGWKKITLSCNDILKTGAYNASFADIRALNFRAEGWGNTPTAGTVLYFDKIWLERAGTAEPGRLADFTREQDISAYKLTSDSTYTLNGDVSAKWVCKDLGATPEIRPGTLGMVSDWTAYDQLNMWIYSPGIEREGTLEPFNSKITVTVWNDKLEDGKNRYFYYHLKLDWLGWKKVELPLSMLKKSAGTENWSQIAYFNLNASGWSFPEYEDYKIATIYLDSIWLSRETAAADRFSMGEFDTDTEITAFGFTPDTAVTRMYEKSAKWDIGAKRNPGTIFATSGRIPTDWSQYGYLNMWLHMPEGQSYADKKEKINIIATTDQKDTNGKERYFVYKLFLKDLTSGWQRVTLPLSQFAKGYEPTWDMNIVKFYFDTTGWLESGYTYDYSKAVLNFDSIWLSKNPPADGLNLLSTEPGNLAYDVEPDRNIASFVYDNPLSVTTKKYDVSVQKTCVQCVTSAVTDFGITQDGEKISVIFPGKLDIETNYKVTLSGKVYDRDGNENAQTQTLSFTTRPAVFSVTAPAFLDGLGNDAKAMPLGGKLSARAEIVNETAAAKNVTVILAVYDAAGKLVSIGYNSLAVQPKSNASLTSTVNLASYAGCNAKAFVWDEINGMAPYGDAITLN